MKAFKFLTAIRLLIVLIVVAGVAGLAIWLKSSPETDSARIEDARIKDVRSLAQLCAMEIYEEIPIKAHIGTRHLFARQRLRGSISFDIDKLVIDASGDTVREALPPETVEIYESTEPDSYKVIDTWNTRFLGSDKFTAAEENSIKAKAREQWIKRQYASGTVRRARAEATVNLRDMLSTIYQKPAIVFDPTPNGIYKVVK